MSEKHDIVSFDEGGGAQGPLDVTNSTFAQRRRMSAVEIEDAVRSGSVPKVSTKDEALDIARAGGWEADALVESLEQELQEKGDKKVQGADNMDVDQDEDMEVSFVDRFTPHVVIRANGKVRSFNFAPESSGQKHAAQARPFALTSEIPYSFFS